jgi:predicted dehydrogenase
MPSNSPLHPTARGGVRVAVIGGGFMARIHIAQMLKLLDTTQIVVVSEPSPAMYEFVCGVFAEAGLEPPPNQPDLSRLLSDFAGKLDAAFIISPHAYHHDQTKAFLEAGLDVLLEKPMVLNAAEARSLIEVRDRTGRLLVVAFPGGLSPQIRTAVKMLRSGELGELLSISATVWQNWGKKTEGTWRQQPEIAGGGFLFDTGAHMLNTVCDLAGEDIVEVAAWLDNHGRAVETLAVVNGRLASGALVTFHACGETILSCASDVRVFCKGAILYTGIWGEKLEIQRDGEQPPQPVPVPPSTSVWEQFLAVRRGEIPNSCPPEVGLRMSRLWDAIQESAANGGVPARVAA